MNHTLFSTITDEPLDIAALSARVESDEHGASLVFLGWVRNNHEGKRVEGITYDCFLPLALKTLEEIVAQTASRFSHSLSVSVAHRIGHLNVGECSLVIAVGSGHRPETYEASRQILEEIKLKLPVWKKEHYIDGESSWLKGSSLRTSDAIAIVLVGGRSSRMGENKALLKKDGLPLFERTARLCAKMIGSEARVFLSGSVNETHKWKEIPDLPGHKGSGPVGGLLSVLHSLPRLPSTVLLVPVDLPLLEEGDLERLIFEVEKESRTTGVYFDSSVLPCTLRLESDFIFGIEKELHSIKDLHRHLQSRAIETDAATKIRISNVNTPEDWERVKGI